MAPTSGLRRSTVPLLALAIAAAALPGGAGAQQGGGRGFLFHEPRGSVTLRGGMAGAQGRSDVFSFVTQQLTLGRGDFTAPAFGADFAFALAPRVDLMFGASYMGRSARSEFREWVDQDDQPIEQTTALRRVPLTAGLKVYLLPRGRTIGRFAWVPSRAAPYVGGGAGMMWYRFSQKGDFVDEATLDVFGDEFVSSGRTPTAHALAGVDFSLSPYLALTGEGRYGWAKGMMGGDFERFDRIDLSGYTATIGLSIRY